MFLGAFWPYPMLCYMNICLNNLSVVKAKLISYLRYLLDQRYCWRSIVLGYKHVQKLLDLSPGAYLGGAMAPSFGSPG